ncbi:hypothetical protein V8F20_004219 [Naviculisporaceae sp. PSN 640]
MLLKALLPLAGLFTAVTAQVTSAAPAGPTSAPSFPAPDLKKITSVPQSKFKSYKLGSLHRASIKTTPSGPADNSSVTESALSKRWECTRSPIFTWGDADNTIGIRITNGDSGGWRGFYIYHNSCDNSPYKYIWIEAGQTRFVSLPRKFEGRIVRGEDYLLNGQTQRLATWFEFAFDDANVVWGDVSLIRGTDGAVLMWSEDGSGAWKGWDWWILDGAPGDSYAQKPNGQWVLKWTVNNDKSINRDVRDYLMRTVGADRVYVDDDHGNPVISSRNGRFGTYWGPGRP